MTFILGTVNSCFFIPKLLNATISRSATVQLRIKPRRSFLKETYKLDFAERARQARKSGREFNISTIF